MEESLKIINHGVMVLTWRCSIMMAWWSINMSVPKLDKWTGDVIPTKEAWLWLGLPLDNLHCRGMKLGMKHYDGGWITRREVLFLSHVTLVRHAEIDTHMDMSDRQKMANVMIPWNSFGVLGIRNMFLLLVLIHTQDRKGTNYKGNPWHKQLHSEIVNWE